MAVARRRVRPPDAIVVLEECWVREALVEGQPDPAAGLEALRVELACLYVEKLDLLQAGMSAAPDPYSKVT